MAPKLAQAQERLYDARSGLLDALCATFWNRHLIALKQRQCRIRYVKLMAGVYTEREDPLG